jgi:hypothetical protein
MKSFLRFLLLLGSFSLAARATETTDLGYNLSYLRVHSLADSVPVLRAALSAKRAFVLDLRYATATDDSLAALRTALAAHPAGFPLFILISPATPAAVVDAANQTPGSFVTLGITSSRSAKITVKADAATDRKAYDALDNGTPVAALISGKVEKERFDEATLVQEFKNGNADAAPPALPDPTVPKPADAEEKPAPLIDHVLQRAVQLHQALLALHP